MNPDLYTEEFRNFKYLKSSPTAVRFYRENAEKINKIRPITHESNKEFKWKTRIEFVEQLFDLRNDTVYMVELGMLKNNVNTKLYDYELAKVLVIRRPRILYGKIIPQGVDREATLDDVPLIENKDTNGEYFLYSGAYRDDSPSFGTKIGNLPLIPNEFSSQYSAMFYDAAEAESYAQSITIFLRLNNASISAISRML